MGKTKELKKKYKLRQNGYKAQELVSSEELSNKWEYLTAEGGWCGVSLGSVSASWVNVLDEFLTWALETCPEMKIQQVKIKFGAVRLYLAGIDREVSIQASDLEKLLFDKRLVY